MSINYLVRYLLTTLLLIDFINSAPSSDLSMIDGVNNYYRYNVYSILFDQLITSKILNFPATLMIIVWWPINHSTIIKEA